MAQYYPAVPALRPFNAQKASNIYANWQGVNPLSLLSDEEKENGKTWKARVLIENEVVEDGYQEIERVKGAGWLWDEKEDARVKKVERRRRIGKGPPEKGKWFNSEGRSGRREPLWMDR